MLPAYLLRDKRGLAGACRPTDKLANGGTLCLLLCTRENLSSSATDDMCVDAGSTYVQRLLLLLLAFLTGMGCLALLLA